MPTTELIWEQMNLTAKKRISFSKTYNTEDDMIRTFYHRMKNKIVLFLLTPDFVCMLKMGIWRMKLRYLSWSKYQIIKDTYYTLNFYPLPSCPPPPICGFVLQRRGTVKCPKTHPDDHVWWSSILTWICSWCCTLSASWICFLASEHSIMGKGTSSYKNMVSRYITWLLMIFKFYYSR